MPEEGQSFDEMLSAAVAGAGEDNSTETLETLPGETAPETEVEAQPADTATDEDATGDELTFDPAILQQNPQLVPLAKQFQAAFTKKAMALAEKAKALETGSVQWARQLEEVAAVSPQAAVQMLRDAQERLLQQSAAQPEEQVYDTDDDLWTDNERQLRQENQSLAQRLARIEQDAEFARVRGQVEAQFGQLEAEFGVKIPNNERLALLQEMHAEGIPVSAAAKVWRGTKGHEHALRRGREEGEKGLRARQALPSAPSGINQRESDGKPSPKGMDFDTYLNAELASQ